MEENSGTFTHGMDGNYIGFPKNWTELSLWLYCFPIMPKTRFHVEGWEHIFLCDASNTYTIYSKSFIFRWTRASYVLTNDWCWKFSIVRFYRARNRFVCENRHACKEYTQRWRTIHTAVHVCMRWIIVQCSKHLIKFVTKTYRSISGETRFYAKHFIGIWTNDKCNSFIKKCTDHRWRAAVPMGEQLRFFVFCLVVRFVFNQIFSSSIFWSVFWWINDFLFHEYHLRIEC